MPFNPTESPLDTMTKAPATTVAPQDHYDVIVIGAGMGGIYATYRFTRQGLSVLTLESAEAVGGVWYHNRYPGARVDIESLDYCFTFSKELFREWKWSERYAAQPELERYLNHVADKFDLRKHMLFNCGVTAVRRLEEANRWEVDTSTGKRLTCRFVVTAMGNLSAPRKPDFPGLEDFKGKWLQTSRWPKEPVDVRGKRIGVIGTGASGVQVIPPMAEQGRHLTVFQRSPNFVVPPQNRPLDPALIEQIADRLDEFRAEMFANDGVHRPKAAGDVTQFSKEERERIMEERYQFGGHVMSVVFKNEQVDWEVNQVVSDFVRDKIRSVVKDPVTAEKLCPRRHGVGNRRLGVCTDYYETFNRDNVTLVDLHEDPLVRITETGIQTRSGHHELDLIIFSLGFVSFTGTLIDANIRNEHGRGITEHWKPGWKTMLGFMTSGFKNLFMACGTGGIGFSANGFPVNEQQINWIGDCIAYMDKHGYKSIEADPVAEEAWVKRVAEVASNRLLMTRKLRDRNVHVNPETGEHFCMTWLGGFTNFIKICDESAAKGYEGFILR
jgi:cation diffusion facilitator CzcD-associated flavoprotein CzcO